jgi:hypothetical protein
MTDMRKCRNWQTSKTKDLVLIASVWVQVPSSALEKEKRKPFNMEVSSFLYILKIELYMLCKTKSYRQMIEPASKPIENLDNRLTLEGFRALYEEGKKDGI